MNTSSLPALSARALFPLAAVACLTGVVSSSGALLLGVALAVLLGNPYASFMKKQTHRLLAWSVVGLGFGMNLGVIGRVGVHGLGYTIVGIGFSLALGTWLGRRLGVMKDTATLVTVGTAICGGSAIAAVAPVIRAKEHETSVALGCVFLLNAVALVVFPFVGHALDLSEAQFGLWSALAIHDTSSVVGATLQYGPKALELGTTVKLARALWIIPVAAGIGWMRSRNAKSEATSTSARKPWFILGFLLAAGLVTWLPEVGPYAHWAEMGAKRLMVLTLFCIGASLTRETIKNVGLRPFVLGVVLWLVVATGTLGVIYTNLIE